RGPFGAHPRARSAVAAARATKAEREARSVARPTTRRARRSEGRPPSSARARCTEDAGALPAPAGGRALRHRRSHRGAPLHHHAQLLGLHRATRGFLLRDKAALEEREEALVERLHLVLVLTHLHRRV